MRNPATIRLLPVLLWRSADTDAEPLDGRLVRLLAGIKKFATLRAAARDAGLSYRAAWGVIGDTARQLGVTLVELRQGRGARLTDAGEQFLAAHERASERLQTDAFDLVVHKPSAAPRTRSRLVLAASHDLLLAAFCDQWAKPQGVIGELTFRGSLDSLKAFARNEADIAGFHMGVPPEPGAGAGFRQLLDPRRDTLLRFAQRDQGLIVPQGNPKRLRSLADIATRQVQFVNRQRGSGTRLLIDQLLRQAKIAPASIRGYAVEEYTHLAVAATIAAGQADAGFGLKAAAQRFGLEFVPLRREIYCLGVRARRLNSDLVRRLRDGLTGDPLRTAARGLAGYSIEDAGTIMPFGVAV